MALRVKLILVESLLSSQKTFEKRCVDMWVFHRSDGYRNSRNVS
jgi:hypothetical protein